MGGLEGMGGGTDQANKVEEGLHFRLEHGAVGLVEVEDDAEGDDGVVLVVLSQNQHGELGQVVHVGAEGFVGGEAVQDLEDEEAELVLRVVRHLEGGGEGKRRGICFPKKLGQIIITM